MELILVRHGKAEERNEEHDDSTRALTADGRKKLLKTLPALRGLIRSPAKIQIWSSPLTRAAETADIMAGILGLQLIVCHDFIADGNYDALLAALAEVKSSETIMIFGHEPTLGLWSQALSGHQLMFKKGAAAGFAIDSLDPVSADLLWFIQPQAMQRLSDTLKAASMGL
jgi:phosphohistidine phosphatase